MSLFFLDCQFDECPGWMERPKTDSIARSSQTAGKCRVCLVLSRYFYLSIPPKEKWTGKCRARRPDRTFFVEEPTSKKNVWPPQDLCMNAYCIMDLYIYIYVYLYIISWSFQRSLPSHLVNSSCSNSIKAGNFLGLETT